MCLLAIQYKTIPDASIVVAANRDERYNREATGPEVQEGSPLVLCGVDLTAGGTWLGVNEYGLLAAVTNRQKTSTPLDPPSRGTLCRTLLSCDSAASALEYAMRELRDDQYAGANYLCADADGAAVIHAGDDLELIPLDPGLHILTNSDLNDAGDERLAHARRLLESADTSSAAAFLSAAERVTSDARIIIREAEGGTVSSTLIGLTTAPSLAILRHAAGPPDACKYADLSPVLRELVG